MNFVHMELYHPFETIFMTKVNFFFRSLQCFPFIFSDDRYRPILSTPMPERTDYINAVTIAVKDELQILPSL